MIKWKKKIGEVNDITSSQLESTKDDCSILRKCKKRPRDIMKRESLIIYQR